MKNLIGGLRQSLGTTVLELAMYLGVDRNTLNRAMGGVKTLPLREYEKYAELHIMVIEAEKSEEEVAATAEIVARQEREAQDAAELRRLKQELRRRQLTAKLEKMKKDHAAALHSHRILHIMLANNPQLSTQQTLYLQTLIHRAEDVLEQNSLQRQQGVEGEMGIE